MLVYFYCIFLGLFGMPPSSTYRCRKLWEEDITKETVLALCDRTDAKYVEPM